MIASNLKGSLIESEHDAIVRPGASPMVGCARFVADRPKMICFGILLLMTTVCFGQSKLNVVQTGVVDARGATWIPPTSTFSNPPDSPTAGTVYIFTDASAAGSCSGGGSALATCRWSGAAWQEVGTGGGGSATPSIFSGGTQVLRTVQCASGNIPYTALTATATSQEIPIQTGISGSVRWDQVLISETTQFSGGAATALTVSMGRPGSSTNAEMTGALVPLRQSSGDVNFWSARPIPPQLGATYSLVLSFAATGANVNTFTAGQLTWEVCGYAAR